MDNQKVVCLVTFKAGSTSGNAKTWTETIKAKDEDDVSVKVHEIITEHTTKFFGITFSRCWVDNLQLL